MKTARSTILGWTLVPLLVALVGSYVLAGVLLRDSMATSIDNQLYQEAQELQLLADRATNPTTGDSYTSAKELLELFIRRSVPDQDETLFVLVNGSVVERSSGKDLPRLDRNEQFVALVNAQSDPQLADYRLDDDDIRYVVIPVSGTTDSGHMVAAIFIDEKLEDVNGTLTQLAILMLLAFGVAAAIGWFTAGRILSPIRQLGDLTRRMTDGTTQERLKSFDEKTEIGGIAEDFNSMLDRTRSAFAAQSRFVEDAGHELKTPLTILRGHLDLIRTSPAERDNSLLIIEDEVQRMTRIVNDLQLLTKSNEETFIQRKPIDPREIVDEVFVKASPLASRKWKIDIEQTSDIKLDRQRLVQALLQLAENSIKHTSEHDSIVVGVRSGGGFIEFYVGDSGPGIPEQDRERVKGRFVRGSWTPQDTEGSGLGLAIVDAIAKGHNAELFIQESSLGGAEVGIRFAAQSLLETREE